MPRQISFKCYFGCPLEGPLHKFPDPSSERFLQWKQILPTSDQERGDSYIVYSLRLCSRHFEEYFCSTISKRLTRNAIPTINLVRYESKENRTYYPETVQPSTSCSYPITEVYNESQPGKTTCTEILQPSTSCSYPITKVNHESHGGETACTDIHQPSTSFSYPNTKVDLQKNVPDHPVHKGNIKPKRTCNVSISGSRKFPTTGDKTIQNLKKKIKQLCQTVASQKKQIALAKRICSTKSFLNVIDKFPTSIKLFTKMQTMHEKRARGRRFSKEEKVLALTIFKQGPKVYKLLRSMFVLPSKRCLQNLLSNINLEPGINTHVFEKLEKVVTKMPEEKKLVNLLFDEVSLSPGVQYNATTDEVIGFEDLGNGRRVKKLADHALVFMIKGIKGKTKQPVCFTFCKSATKKNDLKYLIIEIIKKLREIGLNVVSTICDQSATNVSVIKSLRDDTRERHLRDGNEYYSKAFEIEGIKVYPLFDTPHLLKGVRNNLINKTAKFEQNNEIKNAKWNHLELLLKIDEGEDEIRLVNKLTENHVVKDKIPKMKVKLAAQVFSQRVSAAMRFLAKRNILPAECQETADFLLIFDKLFDSFNGHR